MKMLKFDKPDKVDPRRVLYEINLETLEKSLVAKGRTYFEALCFYAQDVVSRDETLSAEERKEAITAIRTMYAEQCVRPSGHCEIPAQHCSQLFALVGIDIRVLERSNNPAGKWKPEAWLAPILVDSLTFDLRNVDGLEDTRRTGGRVRLTDCGSGCVVLQLQSLDAQGKAHGLSEVLVESRGADEPGESAQICLVAYTLDPHSEFGSVLSGRGVSEEPVARMKLMPEQIGGVEVMKEDMDDGQRDGPQAK